MKKSKSVKTVSQIAEEKRAKFFPLLLDNGLSIVSVPAEEAIYFMNQNFDRVFPPSKKFGVNIKEGTKESQGLLSTRAEYRKLHHEFFLFKKGKKTVGWSIGALEDFETFYMRNTGILPEFQNKKIYAQFLKQMCLYLKEIGYQRITSQHHGDNGKIIQLKSRQGFMIVGTEIHDRWGSLTKMAKFLNSKREENFKKTFFN